MNNKEAAEFFRVIADTVDKNNRVCLDDFKKVNESDFSARIMMMLAVDRAEECIKALPLLKEVLVLLLGEDVVSFDFVERCKHRIGL